MKKLQTNSTQLNGALQVPGDKSISHRAIMLSSIAQGTSHISGFLMADDCLSTVRIFKQLGVQIEIDEHKGIIIVHGKGLNGLKAPLGPLDCGNSGTTMRLLSGLLSGCPFEVTLFGDDSLSRRPMQRVMGPLIEMGAHISGENHSEYAPLTIHPVSHLEAIHYQMPVASAQVKSAILLAALQARGTTVILEKEKSRDHTERMLARYGVAIEVQGNQIRVAGGQTLTATDSLVPGDISSAAFFIVASLLVPNSQITLTNVGINPTRIGLLKVIQEMGGQIKLMPHKDALSADITVKTSTLEGTTIEGEIIPTLIDELPIIALLATQANGTTIIRDASELRVKETDRIAAIATELNKMGANIIPTEDGMMIKGPTPLHGAQTQSYNDHRIGMTIAIAALLVKEGEVILEGDDAVRISYPEFFSHLDELIH